MSLHNTIRWLLHHHNNNNNTPATCLRQPNGILHIKIHPAPPLTIGIPTVAITPTINSIIDNNTKRLKVIMTAVIAGSVTRDVEEP